VSEQAAPARFDEQLYRDSMEQLRSPRPLPVTSIVFVVLMLVFVIGVFADLKSVSGVLVLVAVVLFHEAGHALGMRVFGFRDVRMFFIPFFGAAVSGRPRGAAAWKEAAVSLLGPLPGIVLGLVAIRDTIGSPTPSGLAFRMAEALLLLNAFNLLPLGFLDGGRFLERVLFSRHRVLEVAFVAFGSLALGLLALWGRMYLLALFALLSLGGLPRRWRTLSAAAALRDQHPSVQPDSDRLGEEESRTVFTAAQAVLQHPANERAGDVAETMEAILNATRRAPGVPATLGLLVLYLAGFACSAVGIFLVFLNTGPVEWQGFERGGARVEFPRAPLELQGSLWGGGARDTMWRTVVDGTERFAFTVRDGGDDGHWIEASAARLAKESKLAPAGSHPITIGGYPGREYEFASPGRVMRARMVSLPARRVEVTYSAPKAGENQRRFLESLAVTDSLPGR
jgi:Zn-dependent protease